MTFKEFLEFISQSPGYFIGFLIVLAIITEFGYKIIYVIFNSLTEIFNKDKKGENNE